MDDVWKQTSQDEKGKAISMSVLTRDEFFNRVNGMVGTDTSDEAVSFIEDMTDTYNQLERNANGDGTNWEQKYKELDESWKARYKSRFFSGNGNSKIINENDSSIQEGQEPITIDDLFKEGD